MALSCDICGGSVTGVGGGIFVCDVCGTRYNTDWARAQVGADAPKAVDAPKTAGTPKTTGLTRPAKPEPRRKRFVVKDDVGHLGQRNLQILAAFVNEDGTVSGRAWYSTGYTRPDIDEDICDICEIPAYEPVSGWRDIVAVDISGDVIYGLKADGTMVQSDADPESPLASCRDIVSFVSNLGDFLGVRRDGTADVRCHCIEGGLTPVHNTPVHNWTDLVGIIGNSSLDKYIVGLRADGTVVSTDPDIQSVVSGWTDIVALADDMYLHIKDKIIGLKADGTVVTCPGRCDLSQWRDIVEIHAGWGLILGLKADGTAIVADNYVRPDRHPDGKKYKLSDFSDWRDIVATDIADRATYALTAEGKILQKARFIVY